MKSAHLSRINGCIPAIVTPLTKAGEVDETACNKLISKQLDAGANGLFILAPPGEGALLSPSQRGRMIRICVDLVSNRVPILVGSDAPSTLAAKKNIAQAAELGGNAAVVSPPFYFKQTQESVIDFYTDIIKEISLPIFAYNYPSVSKVYIEPNSIAILKKIGLAGVKDSSGDLNKLQLILQQKDEKFIVLQGLAGLILPSLLLGVDGFSSAVPNIAPEIECELIESIESGDFEKSLEKQLSIIHITELWTDSHPIPSILKAILFLQGICQNYPQKPNWQLQESEIEQLKYRLADYALI